MPTELRELVYNTQVQALLSTLGGPYHWARGTPATGWPPGPSDCSGFAQAALVMLRMLRPTEPDRTAHELVMVCDPVPHGSERLGDLAFYGRRGQITHVMVCLGAGWCLGPRGGGPSTLGNDPKAFVDLRPVDYRSDLVVIGRLKPTAGAP